MKGWIFELVLSIIFRKTKSRQNEQIKARPFNLRTDHGDSQVLDSVVGSVHPKILYTINQNKTGYSKTFIETPI